MVAQRFKVSPSLRSAWESGVFVAENSGRIAKPHDVCDTDARRFRRLLDAKDDDRHKPVELPITIHRVVRYRVGTTATFKIDIEDELGRIYTLRHLSGAMLGSYATIRDLSIEACVVLPGPEKRVRDAWGAALDSALKRVEDHESDAETNPTLAVAQEMAISMLESELGENEGDLRAGRIWQDEVKDIYTLPRILVSHVRARMAEDKPSREMVVDAAKILGCETRRPTIQDGWRPRMWAFTYERLKKEML
jgi:hypothetical protein